MAQTYEPLPTTDTTEDRPPQQIYSLSRNRPGPFLRNAFLAAFALCLVALVSYRAGQWSVIRHRKLDLGAPPATTSPARPGLDTTSVSTGTSQPTSTSMHEKGKHSVGYFVNWGIYGRKFPPSMIPAQDLTHILYAFANLHADTGEVFLSDPWADKDIHYPGDSWNDGGANLYGNFKAIYKLKKHHRHLKVLLSIGGWTYSPAFHPIVIAPALRARFVESSVQLLEDYGLDGLDVDYEYPANDEHARGYVELLRELRAALNRHAREKGADYKFLLTIAAPCGPDNYKKLHVKEMDKHLDFWNMMAYDFSGSWDKIANHQANVFGGPISASQSIHWYIAQGVARSKIVMGIPLYGRSFAKTQGPGTPFSGVGAGSWEAGVYDYRALPLPGAHVHRDEAALASWSYDYRTQEMVSYDNEDVARWKGEWIKKEKLGGSMFWELSGDKGSSRNGMEGGPGKDLQPGRSLVKIVKEAMGGLENGKNWLRYEKSKFDNMRNGME